MSGSGGTEDWKFRGGGTGQNPLDGATGGGGDEFPSKCDFIHSTQLNSPNPDVLATLKSGSILQIGLSDGVVLAKTADDHVAGSITYKYLVDLLECIASGWEYQAEVQNIKGGRCEIKIRPKG